MRKVGDVKVALVGFGGGFAAPEEYICCGFGGKAAKTTTKQSAGQRPIDFDTALGEGKQIGRNVIPPNLLLGTSA
jgi:hypothetical protein